MIAQISRFFKLFSKGYFFISGAQKSAYFTGPEMCGILFLPRGERIRPEGKLTGNTGENIMNKNTCKRVALAKGEVGVYDFGAVKLHAYKTNDPTAEG